MSIKKDNCDEIHDEYIDCSKNVNKDNKDNEFNEFNKDNEKKRDDCCNSEESKIVVNCNLKVDFDTKNKMIYLYPGKSQYFTVNIPICYGDVTIRYKGRYQNVGIRGNLGIYHIVQSGIIVHTYCKLDSRKNDILKFTAIDECTKECYDFVVVFSSHSCCSC